MQYLWDEKSSQCLALFIDIRIASARKVDSFKGTRCALYLFCNSMERNLAIFSYNQCLCRLQFLYHIVFYIHCGLDNGPFGGRHHNLII